MRPPFVAIGLFCDSVRQETAGSDTVVGVLPDNINVPQVPAMMPKLSLYVRIQVDPDFDPNPVSLALRLPDDTEIDLGKIDAAILDRAREQARASEKPYGGAIVRSVLSPFGIATYGRIEAVLRTATDKIVCAHLTFKAPDTPGISVSAEPPPAKRSLPASKKKSSRPASHQAVRRPHSSRRSQVKPPKA